MVVMRAWLAGVALGSAVVSARAGDVANPADAHRAAYEAAAASAGRDAEAQVRLALWCEARGMAAERTKHLTRAVLIDPENAKARGLLGQVKLDGRWLRTSDVARAVEESPERLALQREYLERRSRARDSADDQYQLALWCEEKGLKEPMVAHLHRTLQLDPGREGAWRRLGFKKVGGRWVKPEVEAATKADREAQAKADRAWKPRLEKLRDQVAGRDEAKRSEAQATLAAIDDPRAVPMIAQVFIRGGDLNRQRAAIAILSRMEGPEASLALASLAVYSPHDAIRSDAVGLLNRRDPREFAGWLATLIRGEIKYKVKPVEGPGSQGERVLEGEDPNIRRLYRPLASPAIQPGDHVSTDANGDVVVDRPVPGMYVGPMYSRTREAARAMGLPYVELYNYDRVDPVTGLPMVGPTLKGFVPSPGSLYVTSLSNPRPGAAAAALQQGGVPAGLSRTVVDRIAESNALSWNLFRMASANDDPFNYDPSMPGYTQRPIMQQTVQYSLAAMTAEAQASAVTARNQLEADVAALEAHNAPIRETNERATAVLKKVSGEDRGSDRAKWMDWVIDLHGYGQPLRGQTAPPSQVVVDVPIAYEPQTLPVPSAVQVGFRVGPSCFAGGTKVRTLNGDRPIESIRPGDQVLSQDTATGRLSYQPVVEVMHNPPNWTYQIDLGAETVHPTGIHRFWKAGEGWVMARDIRKGDRLRTVGGVVEVVSAEKEVVQPVFNLLLSGGDNYCVGSLGVIAHDNGLVEPVATPFDGVPVLAEASASRP